MDNVDSTRVFVTGLPKSLTSTQLSSHFSQKFQVTDAHVLPDRHIGFVGFPDHDAAQSAVKHFNRSYIRMSKITVDLAKPIEVNRGVEGRAVPVSQRDRRNKTELHTNGERRKAGEHTTSTGDKKRKRDFHDDGEHARTESGSNIQRAASSAVSHTGDGNHQEVEGEKDEPEVVPAPSDSDWLRGKTSRLLDLEAPEESAQRQAVDSGAAANTDSVDASDSQPETDQKEKTREQVQGSLVPNARLFVRNVAFSVTEDDLEKRFGAFGKVQEVHVVIDGRSACSKGMAYIQYSVPADAEHALTSMDGVAFHGRLLHVLPASDKRDTGLTEYDLSKMPLKKQKAIRKKLGANTASFSWNSMYMNPDAVISSIASRLGVSKSDILDPTNADAAVKQAHAETQIIAETKEYLRSNGVRVEAFQTKSRDDRVILLKNFSFGTSESDMRELLEPYGQITRFILPPTGTMAIVEFSEPYSASQALKGLAYKNIKGSVLYLEKAPRGLFLADSAQSVGPDPKPSEPEIAVAEKVDDGQTGQSATVFIRNLSFNTSTSRLTELLNPLGGFLSARVKTRTDPKRPGEILSMGFGFADFQSTTDANAAIAAINGYRLDGHELLVKPSTKKSDLAEEQRRHDNVKKSDANKTKIIIKNLPFQASKKDVRSLFSQYGQLKNVRLPKKFNNTSRGFAFAEFVTAKEAANAMDSLSDTHLLGRRLVLDFVDEETIDAEEQIQAVERKIEQQSNRINLSKLVGPGRRKFNVGSTEDEVL